MNMQYILSSEFNVYDLDSSPVHDFHKFTSSDHAGLLIDFKENSLNDAQVKVLGLTLPGDYKEIYLGQHKLHVIPKLRSSLSLYLAQELLIEVMNEIEMALAFFGMVTSDKTPLISMRMVTPQYVESEFPSVSQYYHRDASALTLTKCFYGEGAHYLREDNTRREFFSKNSIALDDSLAMVNQDDFCEVPQGNWILLKGEMYAGIDSRNQNVVDAVLGKNAIFNNFAKGRGLIHKGGGFSKTDRRLVFTISTYRTELYYE